VTRDPWPRRAGSSRSGLARCPELDYGWIMSFPARYLELAEKAFGNDRDPIEAVSAHAAALFDVPVIVWEGDAQTFAFSFISRSAEELLGHSATRWTGEPAFWAESVVHPDDRDDAVAYCALATAKCADHAFTYRARAADGRVVWLADYVRVIRGARGVADRLRGIMIDVTDAVVGEPAWRMPTREALTDGAPAR